MFTFLVFAAVAGTAIEASMVEAHQAIAAGRLHQARSMVSAALAAGAKGEAVDRLLADLAFASGKNGEALARYGLLLDRNPQDGLLLERAAISALRSGQLDQAWAFTERATRLPGASWRAWNARGVAADLKSDFATAEASYKAALALSPDQPEALNNLGWSFLLRGDWEGAAPLLEQAASRLPKSPRAANNLELARAALAADLPERRVGETDVAWATRLNDAGVAAQLRGDRRRAIAAFARAIEVRGSWYRRAANNLDHLNGGE